MSSLKTPSVPALERGLAILEIVAKSRNGYTFSQLAERLEFPKSSVHALLVTLERLGYLQQMESTGRYVTGLNLVRIATAASHGITLRQKAGPVLCDLTQRTGLTAHMAILEHNEAILVAKVEPSGTIPVATWLGKRIDYHCTSMGKALIAWLAEDEVRQLVKERRMLRHNENTICTLERLKAELLRTRKVGYAVDDEEEEIGIRCVGVPVIDGSGEVAAAISVSGTVQQIRPEDMPRLGTLLQGAAHDMSQRLSATTHTGVR
ncbi:MAG: IclR family transcriptional regulator [Bryobacterales bacterium]|nr:IclR family transcriptional regulator [Bryobacterales bacterium]